MPLRCLTQVATLLCVLAWPAWAAAEEVLLFHLSDAGSRSLAERARTEIALVRLSATLRETGALDDEGLERAATDAPERAVVSLRDLDDAAEAVVWIFPSGGAIRGRPEIHRLRASGPDRAAILSLRLAELLDTRLRESALPAIRNAPSVDRPARPPRTSQPDPTAKRDRARFGVGFASGLLHGFDGVGPAATPSLGLIVRPTPRAEFGLWVSAPARGLSLSTEHGDVTTTEGLALATALVHLTEGSVRPTLAVGAGAYFLEARAETRGAGIGHDVSHWSAAIASGPGLSFRLSHEFDAFLDASAVLVIRRPVLSVGNEAVASAGRPSLLVRFGVEWLP